MRPPEHITPANAEYAADALAELRHTSPYLWAVFVSRNVLPDLLNSDPPIARRVLDSLIEVSYEIESRRRHFWIEFGPAPDWYQCSRCGLQVHANDQPAAQTCQGPTS
tara:strand:+ start:435 stop:758 length:324 start_codon:yes stop_codon:yes gene_type:complete